LVKKFSVFLESECSLTYSQEPHWSLFWARWIQSTAYHTTSLTSTEILSSCLSPGIPNCLFPSVFPTKILYAFPIDHVCSAFPHLCIFLGSITVLLKSKIYKSLHNPIFRASSYFLPLRPKYSPQHPPLTHNQSVIFP